MKLIHFPSNLVVVNRHDKAATARSDSEMVLTSVFETGVRPPDHRAKVSPPRMALKGICFLLAFFSHYILITLSLHSHYIRITFALHSHYIRITFALHSHYIRITFSLHCHYIRITFSVLDITSNCLLARCRSMVDRGGL
jgi:hypothetical protein